jgi:hypothetical protein
MTMNKQIAAGVVGAVIILVGVFYGGVVYGKSQTPARGQFSNSSARAGTFGQGNRMMNGGFTIGEVISKDASSLTIKMQDGSTKIVLLGSSTSVMKTASGTMDDLVIGSNVTVMGTANSDGSMTAQSVQIRPAGGLPRGRVN